MKICQYFNLLNPNMLNKSLMKKMADNRKKNTVRNITNETKEIVYERDE